MGLAYLDDKVSRTCAEPDHIRRCPLPKHHLRNGRLNQTTYSLFLFIRDVTDGDLVGWIDGQLQGSDSPERLARMRASLIEPLREVYGVSDKVLTMALSCILLRRNTAMVPLATGPVAARTSFRLSPSTSMPANSTRRFRRFFPGSSSTRSGGIAIRTASMSATATALMIPDGAIIWIARSG
jgi:hypothetical protein